MARSRKWRKMLELEEKRAIITGRVGVPPYPNPFAKGSTGRMIKADARDHESLDKLLRRFKKMCEKEGLSKDIKKASVYEKPSEKRARRNRSRKR